MKQKCCCTHNPPAQERQQQLPDTVTHVVTLFWSPVCHYREAMTLTFRILQWNWLQHCNHFQWFVQCYMEYAFNVSLVFIFSGLAVKLKNVSSFCLLFILYLWERQRWTCFCLLCNLEKKNIDFLSKVKLLELPKPKI